MTHPCDSANARSRHVPFGRGSHFLLWDFQGSILRTEENTAGETKDLAVEIAQKAFSATVPACDPSVGVERYDGIFARAVEDDTQPFIGAAKSLFGTLMRLFRLLPLDAEPELPGDSEAQGGFVSGIDVSDVAVGHEFANDDAIDGHRNECEGADTLPSYGVLERLRLVRKLYVAYENGNRISISRLPRRVSINCPTIVLREPAGSDESHHSVAVKKQDRSPRTPQRPLDRIECRIESIGLGLCAV